MRTQLEQNSTLSFNTERMYAAGWRRFDEWCGRAGRESLPASAETLALYVVWGLETENYRMQTIRLHLSAIAHKHRTMHLEHHCADKEVSRLLALESRKRKERSGAKKALPLSELKNMVALCDPAQPVDVRDHAILVLLFNAGLRRAELAALDLSSVQWRSDGGADLYLGATKADPTGAEAPLILTPAQQEDNFDVCPARTLQAWIKVRGPQEGPLFLRTDGEESFQFVRMWPEYVYRVAKRFIQRVGLDPKLFATHSFRSGMMTHAVLHGADFAAVMKRSRHKTPKVAYQYLNQLGAFQKDVMGL